MNVNAPAPPYSGTMDVDAFMAFMETRPDNERWELIEGVAVMMSPSSRIHQRIAFNLCDLLNRAFGRQKSDLLAFFDTGVRSAGVRNYQPQPDVVVVPGLASPDLYSEQFRLAGEVRSPSNTRQEIDLKLRFYREAPHNLYALVIEPLKFSVEIYARRRDWERTMLENADDPIDMPEFGLHCRVRDLYRTTPLNPELPPT